MTPNDSPNAAPAPNPTPTPIAPAGAGAATPWPRFVVRRAAVFPDRSEVVFACAACTYLTRGTLAFKKQWGTWELLIVVEGKRKYVGSFPTLALANEAREHVYQERLAGRPLPDYRLNDTERSERARNAGREGKRRQLACLPPKAKREPVIIPRDDEPVARCRCMLALAPGETTCGSCLPTARDFAEMRKEVI